MPDWKKGDVLLPPTALDQYSAAVVDRQSSSNTVWCWWLRSNGEWERETLWLDPCEFEGLHPDPEAIRGSLVRWQVVRAAGLNPVK
jgi:hypothetical protein